MLPDTELARNMTRSLIKLQRSDRKQDLGYCMQW